MPPSTTVPQAPATAPGPPAAPSVLPLETGDRLTREEFERRYEAMPELKKAELIEGVVYVTSAVRFTQHAEPHADLITWMGVYRLHTPGVRVGDNGTVRMDMDNNPQPDAIMLIDPARGGQALFSDDGYVVRAPELAGEIAASSASLDLNTKLQVYRRNGVREYLVWRVLEQAVDWFVLRGSQYELLPQRGGVYQSEHFPGLWLDAAALVAGDLIRVHDVLRQGLGSPEPAAFVARAQQAGAP